MDAPVPSFPVFSSGDEECTLPRCIHSLHRSVGFAGPGPRDLRNHGPRPASEHRRISPGVKDTWEGPGEELPLSLAYGGGFSVEG